MPCSSNTGSNQSISIGGNVHHSAVVIGDGAQVVQTSRPGDQEMHAALIGLHDLLVQHVSERASNIDANQLAEMKQGLDAAVAELTQAEPNANKIDKAIKTALTFASGAASLGYLTDKMRPHLKTAADWLGQNWHDLIKIITSP